MNNTEQITYIEINFCEQHYYLSQLDYRGHLLHMVSSFTKWSASLTLSRWWSAAKYWWNSPCPCSCITSYIASSTVTACVTSFFEGNNCIDEKFTTHVINEHSNHNEQMSGHSNPYVHTINMLINIRFPFLLIIYASNGSWMHKLTLHLALTRSECAIQNISATYLHFTETYPLPIHHIHV